MDISNSVVENNLSEYHMSYSSYDWGMEKVDTMIMVTMKIRQGRE